MKILEDRIRREGTLLPGEVLKADNFINHQIDPQLFMQMGEDFYQHFKDQQINKILTLEVSGIALAFAAATYFNVPVVFAKKSQSLTLGDDVYQSTITSYTKQKTYDIRVQKNFLNQSDRVLIIDDFLAMGQALGGLIDLCDQASAQVAGIGIAIEKAFQPGGQLYRERGYEIYSQARIEKMTEEEIIFCQN
ncbi:xanthine phosphoribosyltransferase [Ignavigranum ruoffiae]|uniref:xanthine phosphoribosyltransferase n=1 Tax=Ignavigranum ruoffiae TaxID=89093 RepID=UPI0020667A91|nr:xanthine phosphoribosyltransferase [Ignavigranum ruoffiae]UPQ85554.1 xanthine phosphoribosyltransferase [Ignavigranum ruoffiae]